MDAATVETLDALAGELDRDRSYLLNEAVEHYLDLNAYHVAQIEKGLRAAKAGDFVEHQEVKKIIGRMGRTMDRKAARKTSRTK